MNIFVRQGVEGITPPGVPYGGFIACAWTGTAVSGLVLACRLAARFQGPRRLFWDDAFAMFAFVLVLTTAAVWQWGAKDMYYVLKVQAGIEPYDAEQFAPRMRQWLTASLVAELFFYTSLVSIKLAFLFFFRRLGASIHKFRWIWWPVLVITMCCYFATIGNVDYKCLAGPIESVLQTCNTASRISSTVAVLKANCALDIFTDFLIMLLPTILLWKTQIRRAKKFAILGLFSLSIVTMVIAIVRVASIGLTRRPDGNIDSSYLWLWSMIEPCVAIVVSCLSAFPQLFKAVGRPKKKPAFTPSETYLRMMSRIRAKRNLGQKRDSWVELNSVSRPITDIEEPPTETDPEHVTQTSENTKRPVLSPNSQASISYAHGGASQDRATEAESDITH